MNILITSAGQRVSLVRAFQRELKKLQPEASVYTTDMFPEMSAACHASDGAFKVKRVTDPAYIPELLELCRTNSIKMIVPTIDTELLALATNKKVFSDEGITIVISSVSFVEKCRDKRKINRFFEEMSIEIPKAIDKHNP